MSMSRYLRTTSATDRPREDVLLVPGLVRDQAGPEAAQGPVKDGPVGPVGLHERLEEAVERLGVLFDLVEHLLVQVPDLVVVHVELEDPHDAGFQEEIGVLDGRRFGRRHDDAGIGAQEEIERVERAARAQIEDDVRSRELADLTQEPELAVMGEVGDKKDIFRSLTRRRFCMASRRPRPRGTGGNLSGSRRGPGGRPSSPAGCAGSRRRDRRRSGTTSRSREARWRPRFAAIKLLPVPPLPPPMAQIRLSILLL